MNKRQKLVQQQFLNNEEEVIKQLGAIYGDALTEIEDKIENLTFKIGELQQEYDWLDPDDPERAKVKSMIQSKIYQKNYQEQLRGQVDGILNQMQVSEFVSVSDYLDTCYEDGFIGTIFDAHGQGVPFITPIDQEAMVRAVQLDSKISKGLYTRLGEDVAALKKVITAEVSRSIATGKTFEQTALQLKKRSKIGYNNAVRIARTEGHRIQTTATMDAMTSAKEKGADVVKQWDAALDARTRASHVRLDGEIRDIDKKFSNGLMFPGDPSGGAAEVVNCRCALLQRARAALDRPFSKYNGFTGQIEEFDSPQQYDEFKKAYMSDANKNYMNYVSQMEEKYHTKDFAKVLDKMTDREYGHYSKLLANNPVYNKAGGLTKSSVSDIMPLDQFSRKAQLATRAEDLKSTNPNYNKGAEYKQNCQRCVPAYEVRLRGYDVVAKPALITDDGKLSQDDVLVKDGKWLNGLFKDIRWRAASSENCVSQIEKAMSEWGNGARAQVYIQYKSGNAHVFAAEQVDGKTIFIDPQNGSEDCSHIFKLAKQGKTLFARIDNLSFTDLIKECIE